MCLVMKRVQTDALGVPDSSFCIKFCGEEDGKGPRWRRYRIWQAMRVRMGKKKGGMLHLGEAIWRGTCRRTRPALLWRKLPWLRRRFDCRGNWRLPRRCRRAPRELAGGRLPPTWIHRWEHASDLSTRVLAKQQCNGERYGNRGEK
jgi:hypothetical protein